MSPPPSPGVPTSDLEAVTLSIVVPVYDEAPNLPVLYARVTNVMRREGIQYELLFVNDGSRDDSLAVMHALRAGDARVSVLSLSRNFGHQVAITAGMDHARGRAVVVMDADLQDPPEVVSEMLERWRQGYDVVYGVRSRRRGESVFKRATASVFYRLLRSLTSVELPVDAGDFRLISRRALDAFRRLPERHRYVRGLLAWVGFRSTAVSYERDARLSGATKYSLRKMVRFALDGLLSFSTVPLRLASVIGLTAIAGSAAAAAGLALRRWATEAPPSVPAVVLTGVAFAGGVQLVCLGILGEYVGRMHEEVKARPLYVVDHLLQGSDAPRAEASSGRVANTLAQAAPRRGDALDAGGQR